MYTCVSICANTSRYYNEIVILVHEHPPLVVKVLANAHDPHGDGSELALHPRRVLPAHVSNTEMFVDANILGLEPATLRHMVEEEGTLKVIDNRIVSAPTAEHQSSLRLQNSTDSEDGERNHTASTGGSVAPAAADDGTSGGEVAVLPTTATTATSRVATGAVRSFEPVALSVVEIEFGSCPAGSVKRVDAIGTRTIDVHNTSSSALEALWVLPKGPFSVEPMHAQLGPGSVCTFKVAFRPAQVGCFFDEHLECYVDQSAVLRDGRINDTYVAPAYRAGECENGVAFLHLI